jgi:hypothetical protein
MDRHERFLEACFSRREKAYDRYLDRREKLEAEALPLVGELCREGKTLYYINIRKQNGTTTGKTKEFATTFDSTDYLIRNHYV